MPNSNYFKPGDWNANCSMCGGTFKASQLRKHWQGMMRCNRCWEPRQPQDFVKAPPPEAPIPWAQPPADTFVPVCSAISSSAVPGSAGPGCFKPGVVFLGAYNTDGSSGIFNPGQPFRSTAWNGNGPASPPNPSPTPPYPPPPPPPVTPQLMAFDTEGAVIRSINGGVSWSYETPALLAGWAIRAAGYSPTLGRLVALFEDGNNRALFYTDDLGTTWVDISGNLPFTNARASLVMWSSVTNRFLMAAVRTGGTPQFIASSVDGVTWTLAAPTIGNNGGKHFFQTETMVVLLSSQDNVYQTTDGVTWETLAYAPASNQIWSQTPWMGPAFAVNLGPEAGRVVQQGYFSEAFDSDPEWTYWELGTGTNIPQVVGVAYSPNLTKFVSGPQSFSNGPTKSVNAIFWEALPVTIGASTDTVIWDPVNNQYIAGNPGILFTSPDGETWTVRFAGSGYDIRVILSIASFP